MSMKRRVAAVAAGVAIAGAVSVLPAPAGAQQAAVPATLNGSASGEALELSLFGEENTLTLGSSSLTATLDKVEAAGRGESLSEASLVSAAAAPGQPAADPDEACQTNIAIPGREELKIDLACGDAKAAFENGPVATAQGLVGRVDLNLVAELSEQVVAPIQQALEENVLGPLTEAVPQIQPATDTLNELLLELSETGNLVTVEVGDSQSSLATTDKAYVSSATAEGAVIDLFPGAGLDDLPLARIIVGSGTATASCSRESGAGEAAFDGAIARVILAAPLLGEPVEIPVQTGTPVTILEGTPLESTISLGAGSVTEAEDGNSITAVADGVSLHLVKGIPGDGGGLRLALAHAEATIGCTLAQVPPPPPPVPVELPRTGPAGAVPFLPVAGAGLFGLALALRALVRGARRS
jgi:hypothetical protein